MTATPPEVVFLLARLDEIEALAREAIKPKNMHPWGDERLPTVTPEQVPDEVRGYLGGAWGEHFARHDPARVLTDCAFKRALVRRFVETAPPYADARQQEIHETLRDEVIEPMAQLWADHPAFNPAWRV